MSDDDFTAGSIPRKLFLFSLPIMLTNLLQASMQLVNGLWVGNLLGSAAFAALTVSTAVLVVMLAFVLGIAQITRTGVVFNVAVMMALSGVLLAGAEPLVTLFIQDPDSVSFGVSYLQTIALFYPFIGLNFIFNGVVRGSGAMFQVLALNIISLWILRVPLAYGLASLIDEQGIALGIGISFLLSSLFSIAYYRWGGWREKELLREAGRRRLRGA